MNQNNLLYLFLGLFICLMLFKCRAKNKEDVNLAIELKSIVADSAAFLLDVRTAEEFEEGHVKGSINIPLDQLEDSIDELKNKQTIVVFCKSGIRAGKAIRILEKYGIKSVNGGGWKNINNLRE